MDKDAWKQKAECQNLDRELFFDKYENDLEMRPSVEELCFRCPVARECFATAIGGKDWGVWGGVYFEGGKISKEFNRHKTKSDWANVWQNLTTDKGK